MIENFSWMEDREDWRDYVKSLDNNDISNILGSIPSAWNIAPKSHNEFVFWLLNKINPKVIVDLGVDFGYSSFFMALHSEATVYGIDSFSVDKHNTRIEDDYQFVLDVKEKLNLKNLEVIKGYFDDVFKTWDKKIDLIHIDGLHDYNNCKNDCETWSQALNDDGVIIFHDTITHSNDVGLFFSQLEIPKVNFTNSCGLGVASNNSELIEEIKEVFKPWVQT